ncbi:MAG: helicase-related protein [Nitrososphaerales archaeon]
MTKIIDNSKDKLSDALIKEFDDVEELAIASAYFNVHGFGALKSGLANKPMKFLLGREPAESIKWEDEVLKELEEKEDDRDYFTLLQEAIKYFEDPQREVHAIEGSFFHGKAYIGVYPSMKQIRRGVGVVGSSNFTHGGLVNNRELNMLNTDREAIEELVAWFNGQWNSSIDYKETFLSFLKNYITTRTPLEVLAKALYEFYRSNLENSKDRKHLKSLYAHQALTVRDASQKLEKYGGVLIADATGLGKSRAALQLALDAIQNDRRPLLIAPKSILDTTWKEEMRKANITLETISSEKLSSDPDSIQNEFGDSTFIIVDEAHFFRTPSTNRYAALRDLILRNKAQVVLATATPVNNSLMDLYFLLSLYLNENSIYDLYGQTLRQHFSESQRHWLKDEPIALEQVLERFIVRHSRELAKALDKEGKINFPERELDLDPRDKYVIEIDFEKIDSILGSMNFSSYDLSIDRLGDQLTLPDGKKMSDESLVTHREALKKLIKIIVIINLFKRLESSVQAFTNSLETYAEYMRRAAKYARETGYFVPPKMKGDPLFDFDEEDETDKLPGPEELFSKPKYQSLRERCKLTPDEITEFALSCEKDLKTIQKIKDVLPTKDDKLDSFLSRIADICKNIRKNNGILVFSQYAATSNYLYDKLAKETKLKLPLMLVTGSECKDREGRPSDKTDLVREFQKEGGILISTDVLSAGQNLQNAQYVVNYDFPWNPVVLIQRIGRIDRMGSEHKKVYVINVLPNNGDPDDPKCIEHFLGLMKKLYQRLEAIRQTIGIDATTLGEKAEPRDFGIQEAIAKNDPSILERIAKDLEQFTSDPKDTLAKIINEKGYDWLESLPKGIGAIKKGLNRDGLFILFSDGTDFYWRLKYYDEKKELVTSPTDIVDTIMKGDIQNSGESIDYASLVGRMREMKEELKLQLEVQVNRERALAGVPPRPTQMIRDIYNELANSGASDAEELAALFRDQSNRQAVVSALQNARKEGKLLEKAREILRQAVTSEDGGQSQSVQYGVRLTRVCWCLIRPSST